MGLGGMSGVVYGLFGFYWMKATYDPGSGLYMPPSTVIIMVGWLLFCMFPGIEQIGMPNVANWAHGVGLLVGIAAGLLPTRKRKTTIAK
jgi:GlpG protein